ncbi:DUF305 domain-containing protein [Nocardia sp. NPDC057353]|uniref:DUF305 domain-containing protein n=1 Tax=Nocardia sp. NPDC057353 TaxID=3346104 RepID=UPI00362E01B7
MTTRTVLCAAAAAVVSIAVLAGCSDSGDSGGHDGHNMSASTAASASAPSSSAATPAGARNEADVAFAQEMIPHHRQAVQMAALVPSRSTNPAVVDLAARIQAAQDPEIATMSGWLRAWGESVPAATEQGGHGGMDHGGGGAAMPGMMSAEQMAAMEAASGAEFDRLWLTGMIAHHQGAVEMARTELAEGSNPEAKALAQKIIDDQQAEIGQMQGLLQG